MWCFRSPSRRARATNGSSRLSRPDKQREHRSAHRSCAVRADAALHPGSPVYAPASPPQTGVPPSCEGEAEAQLGQRGSHPRAQEPGKLIGALGNGCGVSLETPAKQQEVTVQTSTESRVRACPHRVGGRDRAGIPRETEHEATWPSASPRLLRTRSPFDSSVTYGTSTNLPTVCPDSRSACARPTSASG